jgi:protein TonB
VTAIAFSGPGSFDDGAWPRLLAACALSALLHLIVLGVPVNPTGGLPNVVSTIQARLEPAAPEDGAVTVTQEEAAPANPVLPVDAGTEKTVADKPPPQPKSKPAAASPSSPASGVELPLIRDPVYYPARQLDVYPQPVVMIQPKCPDNAVAQRINGRVQVLLLIDEFGVVNEVSIVVAQPAGIFDDATLQGFRAARFLPAQKQGNHVKSRVVLRVNFLCSDTEAAAR